MIFKIKLDKNLNVCPRRKLMMEHIRTLTTNGYHIINYKNQIDTEFANNGGNLDEAYITVLQQKIIELGL